MAATEDNLRDPAAKDLPKARVVEKAAEARPHDPMRAIRLGVFLVALVVGWAFILYNNKFDPTPPVIFVCIGYLALLAAVYALWRTGVVVADENEDYDDSTWERPTGERGELEREKKSLLKAIKEAEFDREMGKLSKVDAEQMITVYRARAIEVIKELDKPARGEGTVREQIMREVRARLELLEKSKQTEAEAKARKKQKGKPGKAAPAKDATADAATDKAGEKAVDNAQAAADKAEPSDGAEEAVVRAEAAAENAEPTAAAENAATAAETSDPAETSEGAPS